MAYFILLNVFLNHYYRDRTQLVWFSKMDNDNGYTEPRLIAISSIVSHHDT